MFLVNHSIKYLNTVPENTALARKTNKKNNFNYDQKRIVCFFNYLVKNFWFCSKKHASHKETTCNNGQMLNIVFRQSFDKNILTRLFKTQLFIPLHTPKTTLKYGQKTVKILRYRSKKQFPSPCLQKQCALIMGR